MTDAELEALIRDVELDRRPSDPLPELDAPLSDDVARAIVERFSDVETSSAGVGPERPEPANRPMGSGNSQGWRWVASAVAVLAAALLLAVLVWPDGPSGPVPTYEATGRTGISEVRSPDTKLIATPERPVQVVLRPSTRTEWRPEVVASAGDTPVPVSLEYVDGGTVIATLESVPVGHQQVRVELRFADGTVRQVQLDVESRP